LNRFIGRVVIGAKLAFVAPYAKRASRKTIKKRLFVPYGRGAMETCSSRMLVKFWKNIVLHDALSKCAQAAQRDIVQQDMRSRHARARLGSAAPYFVHCQQPKQGR
jgi:hypothetical protein